ncbi:thioredoxin family protein [Shewanella sp. C32]|uniref:Thioredoxin family protein n=1 Tax=Shewanella electrica TaxID=515560 RepID=A0ABT2FMQ1_9GAMM|nr:thioredoxin family protein [Shewanella electrica]MCH1926222.1 thioredoxin family protein [Shewanella electrica]MCS4557613.1 thioredoxin family protein [Shewanella electrica]
MHNQIKALLATTAIFFAGYSVADPGCSFEENQEGFMSTCKQEKQEVILTGVVDGHKLVTELPPFMSGYTEYQVDTTAIAPIKAVTKPTEIVVIIGTWCPDCHRETPRFIRIMEAVNNPNIKVTFIGVDRQKQDPEGLAAKYDFKRIPTFMVLQDGKEIGRIVERPTESLEKDLANILK